jgi:DNA-binding NarL/FixJ family response regulator
MSRFLIVDDHPLFRDALQNAVHVACPGAEICEAPTIADAVGMIAAALHDFDLVLLDLALPGTSGFEGLLELRSRFPHLPVMIVSSFEDRSIVRQALAYGAAGFVPKSSKKTEIAAALVAVTSGEIYVPEGLSVGQVASAPAQAELLARLATLTPQQLRVLQMLRQGLLNKQIAYELSVGETTVKAHVTEVLRKLGVYSRTQAVIETAKIDFANMTSPSPDASE